MPPQRHDRELEPEQQSGPPPVQAGDDDERFATNIRETRERLGLSQGELARRMAELGWPYWQQTVRRVESGERKVSVGEAAALARILRADVGRLMLPGREASAAGLIESASHRAFRAHDQIMEWTADLLTAQGQLAANVPLAERAEFAGTPLMVRLLPQARQALALTPEDAVAAAVREVTEGDEE